MPQPHLVQYQGSKRNLAPEILKYFPNDFTRLIEPFAGTAAITIGVAYRKLCSEFVINDLNRPLAILLELVINRPDYVAEEYERIWSDQEFDSEEHYYQIREMFNRNQDPINFLYLLARCVKGAVRYNSNGLFNQSPDKRRKGTRPATMRKNIFLISNLLKGKTKVNSKDYREILIMAKTGDLIYMDPPYQGVCQERDSRYFSGINHEEFIEALKDLNFRNIDYIISYDGSSGGNQYGAILPSNLRLRRITLDAGRSTQATLLGKKLNTIESLYLSENLTNTGDDEKCHNYQKNLLNI